LSKCDIAPEEYWWSSRIRKIILKVPLLLFCSSGRDKDAG